MPYVWTKDADTLDVANLEGSHTEEICEEESQNGPSIPQIHMRARKRHSYRSISGLSAGSSYGDEVSVLSVHSAFHNIPEESALNSSSSHRHSALSHAPMGFSNRSLAIQQSDIESIEESWTSSQQQQQDQRQGKRHSKISPQSGGKYGGRKYSTQTYSEKGTGYSSIYKSYCDEQSVKSAASISSNNHQDEGLMNAHFLSSNASMSSKGGGTGSVKGGMSNSSYYRPSNTFGTAKRYSSSSLQHGTRTTNTNTTASSSVSTTQQQFDEFSFPPAPNNTPTAPFLYHQKQESNIISSAVAALHNADTITKKPDIISTLAPVQRSSKINASCPSTTTKSTSSQKAYSSSGDTTLIQNNIQTNNNNDNGRPPLSKSSSSSSAFTSNSNHTSESKLEKEMYRLSLELASTLSNLDYKKLEVTKYIKQVQELELIIRNLNQDKEFLFKKLERYESRSGKKKKKHNSSSNLDGSSKLQFTMDGTMHIDLNTHSGHGHNQTDAPRCITPQNDAFTIGNDINPSTMPVLLNEEVTNKNNDQNAPDLTFSRDDDEEDDEPETFTLMKVNNNETNNESNLLFPELNESHLTCHDLYSSHAIDDTLDSSLIDTKQSLLKVQEEETVAEAENCDHDNDHDDHDDHEFPSIALDTSISLIDPRDEVFNDDPFATVCRNNDSMDEADEDNITATKEHPSIIVKENQSFNSTAWILPLVNLMKRDKNNKTRSFKDSKNDILNQSIHSISRLLQLGSTRNLKQDLDESSARTCVTLPVKATKPGLFRFGV
jgi:hypothetical protein